MSVLAWRGSSGVAWLFGSSSLTAATAKGNGHATGRVTVGQRSLPPPSASLRTACRSHPMASSSVRQSRSGSDPVRPPGHHRVNTCPGTASTRHPAGLTQISHPLKSAGSLGVCTPAHRAIAEGFATRHNRSGTSAVAQGEARSSLRDRPDARDAQAHGRQQLLPRPPTFLTAGAASIVARSSPLSPDGYSPRGRSSPMPGPSKRRPCAVSARRSHIMRSSALWSSDRRA